MGMSLGVMKAGVSARSKMMKEGRIEGWIIEEEEEENRNS